MLKIWNAQLTFMRYFFEQPVDKRDKIISIFTFKGFRFCLFNNRKVNEEVTWGDNCLPSFEVSDMDKLRKKLDELKVEIVFPLTKIDKNRVLEFKDSEGNDIEVYCKI